MQKRKLLPIVLISLLSIGFVGMVFGYQEYIYTFDVGHSGYGCHGGAPSNMVQSENGTIILSLSSASVDGFEEFTLTYSVTNFTEISSHPAYENKTLFGLSKDMGDNALFMRSLNERYFRRDRQVDENGDWASDSFKLLAPNATGIYNLTIAAVSAVNHTETQKDADYNFTFCYGSILINVTALPGPAGGAAGAAAAGNIPGYDLFVMFTLGVFIVLPIVYVIRKKHGRKI
jgi:hypothetical protein